MTEYSFTNSRRNSFSSTTVQEKKEARKKLLEAVFQRRRERYVKWQKKMQFEEHLGLKQP